MTSLIGQGEQRIRLAPSGKEVETRAGDTVLSALERAGYALPNNCRAGACGECKTKVVSGDIDQGIVLDMALGQSERDDGFGLMCMAKPLSPVVERTDANRQAMSEAGRRLALIIDSLPRSVAGSGRAQGSWRKQGALDRVRVTP